jgi:glyoxylase I family protein
MPALVNHLRLSVADIEAAGRFYEPLMRCLGFTPVDRDDGGLAWGLEDEAGRMQWLIVTPSPEHLRAQSHQYLAPGLHHVAFNARDRAHVDRVHVVLVELGAEILEAPSEYDDEPDHYAVFFRDPDGMKLEVVSVGR